MTPERLDELLDAERTTTSCAKCKKQKFRSWEQGRPGEGLTKVDLLWDSNAPETGIEPYTTYNGGIVSGPTAKITPNFYPDDGSVVWRCDHCAGLFMAHIELGGHGAHFTMRWIRRDLVDWTTTPR